MEKHRTKPGTTFAQHYLLSPALLDSAPRFRNCRAGYEHSAVSVVLNFAPLIGTKWTEAQAKSTKSDISKH